MVSRVLVTYSRAPCLTHDLLCLCRFRPKKQELSSVTQRAVCTMQCSMFLWLLLLSFLGLDDEIQVGSSLLYSQA